MEIALSSKLKLGFVDGSYQKPAANSGLMVYWLRCNNMVTSWLLNSVSPEIRNSIVYLHSAREIWLDLAVRYAQSNGPKLFNLRKEIAHLSQGSLSMSAYFTKFRTVHDELECLVKKPRCMCQKCTCTVNTKLDAMDLNIQITQFLMGLNDTFTNVRGQILMMNPLPTLSQAYAILLQEENQREIQHSALSNDNLAMAVKSNYSGKNQQPKFNSHKKVDSTVICDFCHISGHLKDKCYCIHDYPSWHKLFGKPKPKPKFITARNSVVANVQTHGNSEDTSVMVGKESVSAGLHNSGMSLTDSQCQQIIQMLQRNMTTTVGSPGTSHLVDHEQSIGTILILPILLKFWRIKVLQ
ncbi:uncharacterized protein LOC141660627 [Apium graveolens]|uniref:uncharacterized protein LOC141660627 n=1 Tax=Apium graveolens TaxID=4045 RepID=UPI003D7B0B49